MAENEQEQAPRSAERIAADLRAQAAREAQHEGQVSALLKERQGYVQRGAAALDDATRDRMTDRVAQVDAELERHDAADRIPVDESKAKRGRGASKTAAPAAPADPGKTD